MTAAKGEITRTARLDDCPAGCDNLAIRIGRWNPVARRQSDKLRTAAARSFQRTTTA
jgi:hypothetical protein